MKVVAIADSDSYLKWAASTLAALPADWQRELLIVDTRVAPSDAQTRAALATSGIDADRVPRVPVAALVARLSAAAPDVVLLATRGPVVRVVGRLVAGLDPRPVVATGLPGISIPATRKAVMFREQADLFVLHSRREVREFGELADRIGAPQRFALATLPFAEAHRGASPGAGDLVFAAQAIVPRTRTDRLRVAQLLVDTARADPRRRVVVKVRAMQGEQQTHDETDDYAGLIAALGVDTVVPANLVVSSEPMSVALDRAEGLLTVSSTAAIEAVARGIPVIALDTFGVSDRLINPVFVDSGLFGGEAAVIAREFRHPRASWLDDNYFHAPDSDDVVAQIGELVALRRAGLLPERAATARVGGRLRVAWDRQRTFAGTDRTVSGVIALIVGTPARAVVVRARRVRRKVRGLTHRAG